MAKFLCKDCGECCHIRNNTDLKDEDVLLLVEQADKNGMVYLADPRAMTFPLTREEKVVLEEEAKKREINLKIRPLKALVDSKEKRLFIVNYFINHKICPFYNRKTMMCTCYEVRPLACRAFPILSIRHNMTGKCPKRASKDLKTEGELYFGDTFKHALKLDARNLEHARFTMALRSRLSQ